MMRIFFIAICIFLLTFAQNAHCSGISEIPQEDFEKYKEVIDKHVYEKYLWKSDEYRLTFRSIDMERRLAVFHAVPKSEYEAYKKELAARGGRQTTQGFLPSEVSIAVDIDTMKVLPHWPHSRER